MLMSNSNELIKVALLQKLTNQSMLNGALVIDMVNNSFSENKNNFGQSEERYNRKNIEVWAISTRFC